VSLTFPISDEMGVTKVLLTFLCEASTTILMLIKTHSVKRHPVMTLRRPVNTRHVVPRSRGLPSAHAWQRVVSRDQEGCSGNSLPRSSFLSWRLKISFVLIFVVLFAGFSVLFPVRAQTNNAIYFEAVDLTDIDPGKDLWQYNYNVTGFDFQKDQGFSIFFDISLFRDLQNPPPQVNADWNVISVQPDPVLRDPGFYDAVALRDSPSVTDPFRVGFVWLGQGTPASQPFTLYNADFSTRFSGQTVMIPEPCTAYLVVVGVAGLLTQRERVRRVSRRTRAHGSG